jgi:hypothetical protein
MEPRSISAGAPLSQLSGLATIFFSPAETYEKAGPRGWLVPFLATCLIALLLNVVVVGRVGMGTIVRNQLESNERVAEQLGPAGIDKAVADAENSQVQKTFAYVAPPIVSAIIMLAVAGMALALLLVMSAATSYAPVLTAVAWATYAVMTVTFLGTTAVVYSMSDFAGVDMMRLFALNAGIFFREGNPVLRALISAIDLLAFWAIFLEVVGVTRLSQRVTTAQALGAFVTLHILFTLVKTGWAAIFG